MTQSGAVQTRLPELDWMRGAAALAVVAFHYLHKGPSEGWMHAPRVPLLADIAQYGYLGVHLFFMISGYVILMTAQNAHLRAFFASRAARLVPALWVCVFATASIEWLVPQSPFRPQGWGQILANLTLFPQAFGQAAIDGAYWSLAVELTFYIWIGLLVACRQMHRIERFIGIWMLISLLNVLRPMYPLQLYLAAQWAPLFSAGAMFFLVRQSGWTAGRRVISAASLILACVYAWKEAGPVEHWRDLVAFDQGVNHLVVLALIVAFFAWFLRLVHRQGGRSPTVGSDLAGRLTYPLYLLHQHAGYALFNLAFAMGWVHQWGLFTALMGLVLLMVLAAWAIHVCAEQPLGSRLYRWVNGRPRGRD
jgi:peptidoglycan/LPS O-acetylase OafA/YrhL